MSRLRRLVLSDRFFFITCRLLPRWSRLEERDYECLARVFLPDHWHAIIFPRFPLTISRVMESIKVGSTHLINGGRKEPGLLWQPRFFDRAVRTVKEYYEKVEYIHQNPVRARLVERAEDWPWSSVRDYSGSLSGTVNAHPVLPIDRILLPADERTRI